MELSAKKIEKLKAPGRYGDGAGLYLQITDTGVKSWVLRYERNGRERMLGLGTARDFTLKEARERARRARQLLADGIDPIDAKRAERAKAAAALTFEQAAEHYFKTHEKKWNNAKHRQQFGNTLRDYAFPVIGNMPVAAIGIPDVLRVVEPIWATKTRTANRVRGRIESVLDWCTVRGLRSGDNPATWNGRLDQVLPAPSAVAQVKHHNALAWKDIGAFVADLRTREGVAASALEFTILTAARTGEVIGARWDEIDLENRVWTIPASRMKMAREHRVPLSDRAVALLRELPTEDNNEHVFLGARAGAPLHHTAMIEVLERMGRRDITVHGFRSTFRTWAGEQTRFPHHVCELALAHTVGSEVERAYHRTDLFEQRRALMNAWDTFIERPAAEVVPLARKVVP